VGGSVLQHQQQAALVALVAPEPGTQRLEESDDPGRVDAGRQADCNVKDRFGGQSGDGGGADVFDGDRQLP
jgi:hypothetical protein